jgi:hypothetical protein
MFHMAKSTGSDRTREMLDEVASLHELDDALSIPKIRTLRGEELVQAVKKVFSEANPPRRQHVLPSETHPWRVMVTWRLVRAFARALGMCSEEEMLSQATEEIEPDPWTNPVKAPRMPTLSTAIQKGTAGTMLNQWQAGGLPLMPPRKEGRDDSLKRWRRAAASVGKCLRLDVTEGLAPCFMDLLNPRTTHLWDVTPRQVMALEDLLVDGALDSLLKVGEIASVRHFRTHFLMEAKEARELFRLAKAQLQRRHAGTMEEKRALAEARLEDLIARAREEMNTQTELRAIKELAKIQGITRTSPEDMGMEFYQTVKRIATQQDQKLLGAGDLLMIQSESQQGAARGAVSDAVPVFDFGASDPDELVALREFDAERK